MGEKLSRLLLRHGVPLKETAVSFIHIIIVMQSNLLNEV